MSEEKDFLKEMEEDAESGMTPEEMIEKQSERIENEEVAEEVAYSKK